MKILIRYGGIGAGLILATYLSFWLYPGSTFCEEDTQIYLPILEQRIDPALLQQDLITQYPHTQFTLYDELIVSVARHVPLTLRAVMRGLQFFFRFVFALGFFLIGKGMRLADGIAASIAALMLLGGSVPGPSINIVELEPIPRMMALALIVMAMGLVTLRYLYWGTLFACLGYLLHATTTLPFWVGWLWVILAGHLRMGNKQRLLLAAMPTGAMAVLVYAASKSPSEPSRYFWSFLDPQWEALLWLRTRYDFVSGWAGFQFTLLLGTVLILPLAYYRSHQIAGGVVKRLIWPTTIGAVAMLLSSWLLLDHYKMAIMTQAQLARSILFPVAWMLWLSWTSVVHGSRRKGLWAEGCLWTMSALAFVANQPLLLLLWPVLGLMVIKEFILEKQRYRRELPVIQLLSFVLQALVLLWVLYFRPFGFNGLSSMNLTGLAVLLAIGAGVQTLLRLFWNGSTLSNERLGTATYRSFWVPAAGLLFPAAVMSVFFIIPGYLRDPSRPARPSAVFEVANWAVRNTPVDSVFLFPDAGRSKAPGYFRYCARRAVYVDWKGGGQVNFSRRFAMEWWNRWETAMPEPQNLGSGLQLRDLPVNFVVTQVENKLSGLHLVHHTDSYNVYSVR